MDKRLDYNSSYHPQIDGHTEVVNKSLGNLLWSLVFDHPKQWDQVLAQEEYADNDSPNKSIDGEEFSNAIKEFHDEVKQELQDSNLKYKAKANLKRR